METWASSSQTQLRLTLGLVAHGPGMEHCLRNYARTLVSGAQVFQASVRLLRAFSLLLLCTLPL